MTRRELIEYYQTKLENPKLSPQSRKIAMATWGELKYTEDLEREHRALQAQIREDRHTRPQRPPGPLEGDFVNWEEIGARIKLVRESRGMTQTDLASRIRKTESSVRKYESGLTEVPLSVLSNISSVLGISISWVLGIESGNAEGLLFDRNPDLASGSGRAPREEDNPGREGSKGCTLEIAHGIPVVYLEAADD